MGIQISIVLTWAKGAIFFGDEEEQKGLWRFRGNDVSCFQVFFDEVFARFHLLRVQGVNFGDFQDKGWFEVNDMVVGSMQRKFVMSLF